MEKFYTNLFRLAIAVVDVYFPAGKRPIPSFEVRVATESMKKCTALELHNIAANFLRAEGYKLLEDIVLHEQIDKISEIIV